MGSCLEYRAHRALAPPNLGMSWQLYEFYFSIGGGNNCYKSALRHVLHV